MQENKEASGFNVLQLGVSLQRIARGGMWILTQTKYMIVKGLPRSVSFQYETFHSPDLGHGPSFAFKILLKLLDYYTFGIFCLWDFVL